MPSGPPIYSFSEYRRSFFVVRRPRCKYDLRPRNSEEVKNACSYILKYLYIFPALLLHKYREYQAKDNAAMIQLKKLNHDVKGTG
jgi:hypothetical protein